MNAIRSTTYIAIATAASRVLGFVRDMVIAWMFGATWQIDAFFVAFRIPNLMRRLVAEGTLSVPLVSVLMSYRQKEIQLQVSQKFFPLYGSLGLLISAVCSLAAPHIIALLGYGFEGDAYALSIQLLHSMALYCLCAGFIAYAMGVLNTYDVFFVPALSPALLNVGIILFCLLAYIYNNVMWLAYGVVAGGLLQCVVVLYPLHKNGVRFSLTLHDSKLWIKLLKLIPTSIMGVAVYHINVLVNTMMASTLTQGSVSYLYYADRFIEIVSGVFIISMSNAFHPKLSRLWEEKDFIQLQETLKSMLLTSLGIALPASAGLVATGRVILATFFEHGQFTAFETAMTYNALLFAALGIPAFAVVRILMPIFVSMKAVHHINGISMVAIVTNAVLGFFLMHTHLAHGGLTLANSISLYGVAIALALVAIKKIGLTADEKFLQILTQYCIASGVMGILLFLFQSFVYSTKGIIYTGALVGSGIFIYALLCKAMNPSMQFNQLLRAILKDR